MAGEVARRRALAEALGGAHTAHRAGRLTMNGHYQATARTVDRGIRYSARVDRHARVEVSISMADGRSLLPETAIADLQQAHLDVHGSPLVVAYTEPRSLPGFPRPVYWAVLHVDAKDSQTGVFERG